MIIAAPVRPAEATPQGLSGRLLGILREHPGLPFPFASLAEMLDRDELQIEMALEELEGPVASDTPGAFVHLWWSTHEAIFIP